MNTYRLRQFEFFQSQEVKDPPSLFKETDITLSSSGTQLILFDSKGTVHLLDRELVKKTFVAFDTNENYKVTLIYSPPNHQDILVTIGEPIDSSINSSPIIKVWELDRTTNFLNRRLQLGSRGINNMPYLLKSIKILNTKSKVTSFSSTLDMRFSCIGLLDGQAILIKGNIAKDRFLKQVIIHTCAEPITGLGFSDFRHFEIGLTTFKKGANLQITNDLNEVEQSESEVGQLDLFITTTRQILHFSMDKNGKEHKVCLDDQGCNIGCAAMVDNSFHKGISMARDDALYFYGPDGRGPCLAYQGQKSMIKWFGTQLAIASPSPHLQLNSNPTQLELYDVNQKLIGFTQQFPSPISSFVYSFRGLFVHLTSGQLFRVEEKDLPTKLDLLLNQNLYHLALVLATNNQNNGEGITSSELSSIRKKYGDFLYKKGDFDGAVEQYLETVGQLEPSYVIRKFLDAQRLQNLTTYLQHLHTVGNNLANPDHTTLLLNCYTKLKDVTRLDSFIQQSTASALPFDLDITIKVLTQAKFYSQALYLAHKYQHHEYYLYLQINKLSEFEVGLDYISKLDFKQSLNFLKDFGKILVKECPDKCIDLLLDLCINEDDISPIQFVNLFVDQPIKLIKFLIKYSDNKYNINIDNNISNNNNKEENELDLMELESIWNIIIELYLTQLNNTDSIYNQDLKFKLTKTEVEINLMKIFKNVKIPYDVNQSIVLCKMYHFDQGLLYLYEKLELFTDILSHYMVLDDVNQILNTLQLYGTKDPTLYTNTLEYFASSPTSLLSYPLEFKKVLNAISQHNLLNSVQVIQTLAQNSVATIGSLKEFILKSIEKELDGIEKDKELVDRYRKETSSKKTELDELNNQAIVFQHTKCSACSNVLDLPAIHFLCRHSFHQRCLGQSLTDCPLCFRSNKMIMDLKFNQELEISNHDQFINLLKDADDDEGFNIITQYLGKNAFS